MTSGDLDDLLDNALNEFQPASTKTKESESKKQDVVEETVNRLQESEEKAQVPQQDEEALIEEMMKQFGLDGNSGGAPEDAANSIVEQMMQSLMSKEVLYEPMKELVDQYPAYLKENKQSLSAEEYARYETQMKCCQAIVDHFDDKNSTANISELMTKMQDQGSPPAELMKAMAPDVELDEDGLPKVEGLESAMAGEDCKMQ